VESFNNINKIFLIIKCSHKLLAEKFFSVYITFYIKQEVILQSYSKKEENDYKKFKAVIDKNTGRCIQKKEPALLYEPSDYILKSGGKRIRGILAISGYNIINRNKFDKKIYFASVALEILHLFTLVHDDIMDNADSRRGRATIHKKWDSNTAILSGDLLVGLAYDSLLKANFKNQTAAVKEFNKALIEVCEGQAYDKAFESREAVTLPEYNMMIQKKTGQLMESSLLIGAILAGASANELKALSKYGRLIGRAFQIKDDLLDLEADEKELGKNKFGDIKESKKTFFYVSAYSVFNKKDIAELKTIYRNRNKKESDINRVMDLFNSYGLIEKAQDEISLLISKAKKALLVFPEKKRDQLDFIADKLEYRTF
jgi:geranylgeranyl diphosphate synthase type II